MPVLGGRPPDALDEDRLDRRLRDLEQRHAMAAVERGPKHRLRIDVAVDVELRVVEAGAGDADPVELGDPAKVWARCARGVRARTARAGTTRAGTARAGTARARAVRARTARAVHVAPRSVHREAHDATARRALHLAD